MIDARPVPRPMAEARTYVSRGGDKLAGALDALGVDPRGKRALDAGASSGGFTDCLLARGAIRVVAVDVAYGQLAWSLRNDPRVVVLERTNVRTMDPALAGDPAGLVVADLSFISLRTVRDALIALADPAGDLVLLVKPQFELARAAVPRGGVVRDPGAWREAMAAVAASYAEQGWRLAGAASSPLVGPKGNREFFLHLRRDGTAGDGAIDRAAREAP